MSTENNAPPQPPSPASATPEAPPAQPEPTHPLALAVATLFHSSRDVEECVVQYVPLAVERHRETLYEVGERIKALGSSAAAREKHEYGAVIRQLFDIVSRLERCVLSDPGNTLRIALLLRLFSAYDTFIGNLLRALFDKKPDLFLKLGGEVKITVIIKSAEINSFKRTILNDYIDDFRGDSYSDQFKALEKLTEISTLTSFSNWPSFIEAAQRRNLFAHCGGIVTEQYLTNCRSAGVALPADIKAGDTLALDDAYLSRLSRLIMEVSFKLAQTLWRKLLPGELSPADRHLNHVGYQALQLQEWEWAEMVGEFACGLPRYSDEQNRLVALINRGIAAKQLGRTPETERLLGSVDWSAKTPEFKLAVAVLLDRYDEAAGIMRRIGKKGEILEEASYHTWPLFRDFRGSSQFMESYESVYGYAFVQELKPQTSRLEEAAAGRAESGAAVSANIQTPEQDNLPPMPGHNGAA
jgi:hypothetical protein